MKAIKTPLEGCFILEPNVLRDNRGYFVETFNENTFREATGISAHFVQDNQSFSSRHVLRGLHYQTGEHAQAKLIRVLTGSVWDVAVDLRPESPTYGQYYGVELSADNMLQFYIPRGFAHGFVVLSDTATFFYKCDNFFHKTAEAGVSYRDPELAIDWPVLSHKLLVSERDQNLPNLAQATPVW